MADLVTTPGAANADAYVSLADAEAYVVDGRLHSRSVWHDLTRDDQERAIRWATFLVDNLFTWTGAPADPDQALAWPRSNVFDRDGYSLPYETIPPIIARATAEFAAYLAEKDRSADPALLGLGFREAKVGSISVKVDPGELRELVPAYITAILAPYGTLDASSRPGAGGGMMKLKRG